MMVDASPPDKTGVQPDYLARPLTARIRDACRMTGNGRSKLYELIAQGEIETIKIGAMTLVPVAGLEDFLHRRKSGVYPPCIRRSVGV